MIFLASPNEEDWEDDDLYLMPGDIQVGEPWETPQLLDHHGEPIEPTPPVIGFGRG